MLGIKDELSVNNRETAPSVKIKKKLGKLLEINFEKQKSTI